MAFTRLILHGVGPFEHLDLDLSDGKGKPHLGPHILAGVNGSGKTSVLRALALTSSVESSARGFPLRDFANSFWEPGQSFAWSIQQSGASDEFALGVYYGPSKQNGEPNQPIAEVPPAHGGAVVLTPLPELGAAYYGALRPPVRSTMVAAYVPSRALRRLGQSDSALVRSPAEEALLSFESTVCSPAAQSWLLELLSREALAAKRGLSEAPYQRAIRAIELCMKFMAGTPVKLTAELDPELELRLRFANQDLNFSQLPDGIRSVLGLVVDFMRRREAFPWEEQAKKRRPSVLLYDEIDTHLHPQWQRRVLPALKEALPDVQIIVSTHSPFVISSCPGARVHVFDLDETGRATVRPAMDAPVGTSIAATIIDIFGVESRFDVHTEQKLKQWDEFKKREATGHLSPRERKELVRLTDELASLSEELRRLVAPARGIDTRRFKAALERESA